MKIEELIRKEVFDLPLYEVESILKRAPNEKTVKLDLNENFVISSDIVGKLLLEVCQSTDVRLYPPPQGNIAVKALSKYLGFSESEISVGNGEDELLDLVMKVFAKKNSKVLVIEPSFTMYAYYAQIYGGKKVSVLLKPNFELDVDGILEKNDGKTSLLVLCSPNNPTGNQFKLGDIEKILQEFKGVIVVDEAYVDFAKYSVIDWVRNFDNLIVLRSFSKAFGLAGIRFGFLVSNKSIVEYVKRVTSPFNVNIVAQRLIVSVLRNWEYFKEQTQSIIEEREWLENNLAKIDGIIPYRSDANFILFKVTKSDFSSSIVTKRLENKNVLVKDRGSLPLMTNCIRVTVGTRKMNEVFLSALKEVLGN